MLEPQNTLTTILLSVIFYIIVFKLIGSTYVLYAPLSPHCRESHFLWTMMTICVDNIHLSLLSYLFIPCSSLFHLFVCFKLK